MRSEKEMLELITQTAVNDERIRAAYLEGSRVNPNAPSDIFQDYDVEFIVNDTRPFREDRTWIDRFGKRLYMQYPEESVYFTSDPDNCYGWLIQLADGNRLDLHVVTPQYAAGNLEMYAALVDKDGLLPAERMVAEEMYWIKRPTQEEFGCTCNEFWWCLNNVAKGLWRKELPYVMDMLDFSVRPMLRRLLEWKIGMENGFKVSAGKSGKYMGRFLAQDTYARYLATYCAADTDSVWNAVFIMCDLFDGMAAEVSGTLGLAYDTEEAGNSRGFLLQVKKLPADAGGVY